MDHPNKDLRAEITASVAQAALFVAGMLLSLAVGMLLASILDGPGGLVFSTVVAGAGLLGAAALSQLLREHMLERASTRPPQ
jgi:hypothetical protein